MSMYEIDLFKYFFPLSLSSCFDFVSYIVIAPTYLAFSLPLHAIQLETLKCKLILYFFHHRNSPFYFVTTHVPHALWWDLAPNAYLFAFHLKDYSPTLKMLWIHLGCNSSTSCKMWTQSWVHQYLSTIMCVQSLYCNIGVSSSSRVCLPPKLSHVWSIMSLICAPPCALSWH